MSGQPIDDNEVRRKFQQFGDIKTIRPVDNHHQEYVLLHLTRTSIVSSRNTLRSQRYVEFYDIRVSVDAAAAVSKFSSPFLR